MRGVLSHPNPPNNTRPPFSPGPSNRSNPFHFSASWDSPPISGMAASGIPRPGIHPPPDHAASAGASATESDAAVSRLIEWLQSGSGSAFIDARAGSGKTTAIIKALSAVPGQDTICLMFNRRIMEELAGKIGDGGGRNRSVFTFHAFGRRIWFDHVKKLTKRMDAVDPLNEAEWDSSLWVPEDDVEELEKDPEYWASVGLYDIDIDEPTTKDAAEAARAKKPPPPLEVHLSASKMSAVLKSLHRDELATASAKGIDPPLPSIADLQTKAGLRRFLSLARCNAIPPPLHPVQDLIVDTDLDLSSIVAPLPPSPIATPESFDALFEFYGIQLKPNDFPGFSQSDLLKRIKTILSMALRRSVAWSLDLNMRNVVDFDDMIYLPLLVRGVGFPKLERVFIDEAQDLSRMRIELVRRSLSPSGRVVAVGDTYQSIYAWAGSLPNSLDHLPHAFGELTRFELPITWRCPKLHVELAMEIVRGMQPSRTIRLLARPGAPRGELEYCSDIWDLDHPGAGEIGKGLIKGGELVLARLNQTLKVLAWRLGEWGVPHTCSAIDVGARLVYFLKRIGYPLPKTPDPHAPGSNKSLESLRPTLNARKDASAMLDPPTLLLAILQPLLTQPHPTLHTLHVRLLHLYPSLSPSPATSVTHLSTIHKAKGLERHRVVLLQPWDSPFNPQRRGGWTEEQEANLVYVAMTRAREGFVCVDLRWGSVGWKYEKVGVSEGRERADK